LRRTGSAPILPPMSSSPSPTGDPVRNGAVVTLRYKMFNQADGELLDECGVDDPLVYLQGAGNIVPGLERGLDGLRAGETLDLVLEPDDAFGHPEPDAIQKVPRDEFPADAEIVPGMAFGAFVGEGEEDAEGEEVVIFVLDVDAETVTVSANHPLAGMSLRYDVEVLEVRDARPEELEHGHPHEEGDAAEGCGH